MNTFNFENSSKVGKTAVERVRKYLLTLERVADVEDVQDNPEFWSMDVDLLVKYRYGTTVMVEVKGDRHTTGNVYLELVSNARKGSAGCVLFTEAHYLAYLFVKTGELLILDVKSLKLWIAYHADEYERKTVRTLASSHGSYLSYGIAVPYARLLDEVSSKLVEGV